MRRWVHVTLLMLAAIPLIGARPDSDGRSLFAQSASAALRRDFADPNVSYLLLDARDGHVLAARWEHVERPIPVGSLVKPFTAVAYGRFHGSRFPEHECPGGRLCWLPRGHGQVDIEHALAFSCNAYFQALAAEISSAESAHIMAEFGLDTPTTGATSAQLIGLDPSWRIAPLRLARAYLELTHHPLDASVRRVLGGMAESARFGTGKGIGRLSGAHVALAKTGTAACTHGHAPGDGFAVVLVPADAPSLLLMVRLHGVPGSHAAVAAGQILRRLRQTDGVEQ